ncbi:cytochrome P450 [Streptomyces durmitorensis]|uniref:cytochrome P450 n=1 Tax=Streptomyces durmitorensis TaxID=319947 RepID=UPI0024BD672D|nr:cytochrome P450 [Streptomyces durmitorensis]
MLLRPPAGHPPIRLQGVVGASIRRAWQGTTRIAVRACRIGGIDIEAGQRVVALFAAANRDPAAFEWLDDLVLDRSPNRHLGYGWGPHSCIGTTVAQAGLRALFAALAGQGSTQLSACIRRRQTRKNLKGLETFAGSMSTYNDRETPGQKRGHVGCLMAWSLSRRFVCRVPLFVPPASLLPNPFRAGHSERLVRSRPGCSARCKIQCSHHRDRASGCGSGTLQVPMPLGLLGVS